MKAWGTFLSVLAQVVSTLLRRHEQKKAQAARDELEKYPKHWFAHHFGGMPRNDASKANKADPGTDGNTPSS